MKKSKYKKLIISLTVIAILVVAEFKGILPYVVARLTSSIYVVINYPTNGFKFERAEYAYGFGDYFVGYRNKEGKGLGIMLEPKEFPFIIVWDSIKQH